VRIPAAYLLLSSIVFLHIMAAAAFSAEEEKRAEAELATAVAAAAAAPAEQQIDGLGSSDAPLVFQVRPEGPLPKQYKTKAIECDFDMKPPFFTYFAIQGLGEVPRMMLAEVGASYDHIAVAGGDQALAGNWRTRSPNGLIPMLSGLGIPRSAPICQSGTIIRFLARKYGLNGANEQEECAADIMYETAKDLKSHKETVASMPTKEKQQIEGQHKGPWALAKCIETMLGRAPDPRDPDAAMTYGQLQLLHVLMEFEHQTPGCVKNMSDALDAFRDAMTARPRIARYLGSGMRFPALQQGAYKYASGPLTRGDLRP